MGSSFSDLGSDPIAGVYPGTRGLRLVLPPPGSILGRVVDGEGKPVRGMAIYLCRGEDEYQGSPFGRIGGTVSVACRLENGRLVPEPPVEELRPKRSRALGDSGKRPPEESGPLDETPDFWRVSDDQIDTMEDGTFRYEEIRCERWRLPGPSLQPPRPTSGLIWPEHQAYDLLRRSAAA